MDLQEQDSKEENYFNDIVKRDLNDIKIKIDESKNEREERFYRNKYEVQLRDYAKALNISIEELEKKIQDSGKMKTTFEVSYTTHSYQETWIKGDLCCPKCGLKGVWEKQEQGDYYCGSDYLCPTCGAEFTIQLQDINWQTKQRVAAISAKMKET